MTDPFSVSAGVVGVVSLGLTLGQGFARYYGPWRDYDDEIRGFTTKVDGLLNTLRLLNSFLSPQTNLQLPSDQYRLLVLDNLASCKEACQRLEKMLDECKMSNLNASSSAFSSKRDWLRLKRMAYPFKKDTLVTLSGLVSGLQDNLSLALQLLQSALMSQQQRQIQDLISRTSSISITTTKILTVVDQQVVPTSPQALVQHTPQTTQLNPRTMPEPSLLRDLCDQQQLMNTWLRRKRRLPASQIEQISRYCTCRRRLRFVTSSGGYHKRRPFSGLSLSTYALHENSCPLFLGFSLQVMMTLTRGAGSFAFSPVIRLQAVVASNSPAFDVIIHSRYGDYPKPGPGGQSDCVKTTLLKMFQEGRAAPTDRLEDGSTILHVLCSSFHMCRYEEDPYYGGDFKSLVTALIDAGVPSNERTISGKAAADTLIRRFHPYKIQNQSHKFDEWLSSLETILNSGGYLNSVIPLGWGDQWNYSSSKAARFLLMKTPHGLELHEIEIAILSRSAESLRCCLMSQVGPDPSDPLMTIPGYFHVLFLSLGWPAGLRILLDSRLSYATDQTNYPYSGIDTPIGYCFKEACRQGENECASILLEYLDFVKLSHLYAAANLKDIPILTRIISALVKSRHELQQLALEHLPHDVLCTLSLPSSTLLDSRAFDVYEALADHNIKVHPPHYERASVYGYASNDITIFERLYAAGFTDLNQCDGNSIASLMDPHYSYNPQDPCRLIKSAIWLVCRGASLYQLSEEGYPSFFSLADAFGENLHYSFKYHDKAGQDLRSLIIEQDPDVLEFLYMMITDDSRDGCSCACTNGGCCSSYQQILHGFFRHVKLYWPYQDSSTTAFAALIDALQYAVPGRFSEDQRRAIALQTLRYLTFNALDITHTCHKNKEYFPSRVFEVEEIQEIHEEEADLIRQLDELVAEFARKYDELGYGLHDFIEQYVKPRLNEIVDSESEEEEEVDPDYQQRVRDLGVNLE
ncbi:hypothetical protein ASPCAL05009 [Aspergillus calidoustus]|uniref:Azaphilone pigments biosynthesis cluster protein L N-terminal domain-containing protein n=1 Tax=Aspergillus calidoustus TaxID=454130 RepID=A0A0U5FZR0_ASPCI|nr:hypothetical protein ASPCAL05009 [Aspergillus calidoustus]